MFGWRAAALLFVFGCTAAATARDPVDPMFRRLAEADASGNGEDFAVARGLRLSGSQPRSVLAVIETSTSAAAHVGDFRDAGVIVELFVDTSVRVWLPLDRLDAIALLPGVLRVRQPIPAMFTVVSQGVALTRADRMHGVGARGAGVRIGILDVFRGYSSKVGDELPPSERLHFRSFVGGGGEGDDDHGVRVAEIILDMAPAAELFLAVINDDVGYRLAIDWLISQGVHIINHSGGFGLYGDLRGDGPLHEDVSKAASSNILFVQSAGNSARSHHHSQFRDADADGFHDFLPGLNRIPFMVNSESLRDVRADLMWDEWVPNAVDPRPRSDYQVCIFNAAGVELACSTDPQDGSSGQVPFEIALVKVPTVGEYSVGVRRAAGAIDHDFDLLLIPDFDLGQFTQPESSLISPADHADAFTVGATGLNDVIRDFSSRGPTRDNRTKPDVVAPDGVLTSLGTFFGTSASAPHVSGAAAILKSVEPGLSAREIGDRMRGRAVQVPADGVVGPDNSYGAGRLDANFADIPATPAPTSRPTQVPISRSSGGCRLVDSQAPDSLLWPSLLTFIVLGYGATLGRRG